MNPATALATVIVDELVAGGVREAVLCPGSRNAPLAFALHAADAAGRLRLHVRIDERGAGFLALGLAARSGRPVPVTCTSGTAAANLHPAVLEAHHAGVPLLLLTADRPAELQDTGANQTVDQSRLYGGALRWRRSLSTPGENGPWRAAICQALAAATGVLTADPGPVHLNVELRQPLVPDSPPDAGPDPRPDAPGAGSRPVDGGTAAARPDAGRRAPEGEPPENPARRYAGRPGGRPWTTVWPVTPPAGVGVGELELAARTLVVTGHGGPPLPDWLAELPRIAEPGASSWGASLAAGPWLLRAGAARLRPEQVVVVGRPTLHRAVQSLLADPAVPVTVLTDRPQWTDVAGVARAALRGVPAGRTGPAPDRRWAAELRAAGEAAAAAVDAALAGTPWPTGLAVARDVVAALPAGALLVLGSSNPIRDVSLAARPRADLVVHANRGVAGIDGTVSTAAGAALAHALTPGAATPPGYALLGDLTFLHDATALMIGPGEPRPDLTIVVVNDDGGGIFTLLEQGHPRHASAFERVFATPHGVRLSALCEASGVPHVEARTPTELAAALDPASAPPGLCVVEVRTDRSTLRELHERITAAVAAALGH